jgi:hypothetical protein
VTPKAVGLPLILLAIGHNFLTVLPLEDWILGFQVPESYNRFPLQFAVSRRTTQTKSFEVLGFLYFLVVTL